MWVGFAKIKISILGAKTVQNLDTPGIIPDIPEIPDNPDISPNIPDSAELLGV